MNKASFITNKISLWQKIGLVLFGVFLFVILLEISLRIGGFIILSLQEYRNSMSLKKGQYRILCLGESTTQNEYPAFLEEALNQRNIGIQFNVIDKGRIGANTGSIVSQLEDDINKYNPDLILTMMGINDYGPRMPFEAISTSRIATLLNSFKVYRLTKLLWLHANTKAKELLETINRISHNGSLYYELGTFYMKQGKLEEAKHAFTKAIEFNPKNDNAYLRLGRIFKAQNKVGEAEQSFLKAVEIKPNNAWAYAGLGDCYEAQGKISQIEQAFNKVVELDPKNGRAYIGLGDCYSLQGKLTESEKVLKKAIELNLQNDRFYGALATVYGETGNLKLLKEYWSKAENLRKEYYNPVTISNYIKLKQALDKRKIRLVCVQYPVRSIVPLKKIFEGQEGIIFVDNEQIFKTAILREGYRKYFRDMFAGDFGHCTPKGNKLLAENIASVIVAKLFNR